MSTDIRLRAAYDHLAEQAPSVEDLQLDFTGSLRRERDRRRHAGRLRVALVAATVATVALVALVATVLARRADVRPPTPATPRPAAAAWAFAPNSLPGYSGYLEMQQSGQSITFVRGNATAGLTVLAVTAQRRERAATLGPARIQHTDGRLGLLTRESDCGLFETWCPAQVAIWPLSSTRMAALAAYSGVDRNGNRMSVSGTQLLQLANSLAPVDEPRIGFVRIGTLPAGMRLVLVSCDSGTDPAFDSNPTTGYGSRGYQLMTFTLGGSANTAAVDVAIAHDPVVPLSAQSAASLEKHVHRGPWTRTTVRGHPAWSSPTDILIQWGSLLVSVDNGKSIAGGSDSLPALSETALLEVANSLTVPGSDAFGAGYPLSEALPPGAGW